MAMTRKDYNKLADAIFDQFKEGEQYYKFEIAQAISNALRGTNPRYQSDRFYRACMNDRTAKKPRKRAPKLRGYIDAKGVAVS